MSSKFHNHPMPGESADYRTARDEPFQAELDLIEHVERVAALRRALPTGGELKEDYVFEEGLADLPTSEQGCSYNRS